MASVHSILFLWTADITALAALVLLVRNRTGQIARLARIGTLMLGLHILVVICHQNQFRYGVFLLPATLPCVFVLVSEICRKCNWPRVGAAAGCVALIACMAIAIAAARKVRSEGLQFASFRATMQERAGRLGDVHYVILESDDGPHAPIAYGLYPATTMALLYEFTPAMYEQLIREFPAAYLICKDGSKLPAFYHAEAAPLWQLPPPYTQYSLYRLPPR